MHDKIFNCLKLSGNWFKKIKKWSFSIIANLNNMISGIKKELNIPLRNRPSRINVHF